MAHAKQLEDLKAGWAALAAGEMDKLASFYAEDMIFVLPGQDDVLEGRTAFRAALDGIGEALPPGFEITNLRYCPGDDEIVNVCWNLPPTSCRTGRNARSCSSSVPTT